MLDYRSLTFLEVFEQQSYTRAAEALHITQPAVSSHIRQLEAHYGVTLFKKSGRSIEPTQAARALYTHLLAARNDDQRLVAQVKGLEQGLGAQPPLRFGCTRTVVDYAAPRFLPAYVLTHPNEQIHMRCGNTRELVRDIENGTIDFALVEGSFDHAEFDSALFSTEKYVAVAAPAADDAAPHPASIRDLLGQRLIVREEGSGTREILERNLAAHELGLCDFAGTLELGAIAAIKACAAAGAGISFMYRAAAEDELARGALRDVTPADFAINHDFCLIWQRGSQYEKHYRALNKSWRALYLAARAGQAAGR